VPTALPRLKAEITRSHPIADVSAQLSSLTMPAPAPRHGEHDREDIPRPDRAVQIDNQVVAAVVTHTRPSQPWRTATKQQVPSYPNSRSERYRPPAVLARNVAVVGGRRGCPAIDM